MKKWMLLTAVAFIAVLGIGIYVIASPESSDYTGESRTESCVMSIDDGSFKLVYTERFDNSYISETDTYKGYVDGSAFIVTSIQKERFEFGELIDDTYEKDISILLSDEIFFRQINGGYLVKDVYVIKSDTRASSDLLYVTSQSALMNGGSDITVLKGSSVSDIIGMTVTEIYSGGATEDYAIEKVGDVDLNAVGIHSVPIWYCNGKCATVSLEVVPFIVEKNSVMERGTSFEYAQSTEKLIIKKADGTADITSDKWNSFDGNNREILTCGDYSKMIVCTFTSDSDRTVSSGSIGIEHYIRTGTELPVFSIHMELTNGKVYDVMSDSPDVTVSGYSKDALGAQIMKISYSGSQFSLSIYSYNDSNLIPKEAHLINVNKTYDSRDSLLLYTDNGVNYGNYAIRYVMCDGTVKKDPLSESMVTYYGDIDTEKHSVISAFIIDVIQKYSYSETVSVEYDPTEEDIIGSLSISNIIGENRSAYYQMTSGDAVRYMSVGYRYSDLYVSFDTGDSSSYTSRYVQYDVTDKDSFTLFLSKAHVFDTDTSMIAGAVLTKYLILPDGMISADLALIVSENNHLLMKGAGLSAGDSIGITVTYDSKTKAVNKMDIIKDGKKIVSGTFVRGEGVVLSDKVCDYVDNEGTVSVTMNYGDGTKVMYNVNQGVKDLRFECDEGCSVYSKQGQTMVPFAVPANGLTTSVSLYYM